jgi:adenylate kinase
MFIRSKKVKNNLYAYIIKNKWTKKGSRQKLSKYLGKVISLKQLNNLEFEDICKKKIDELDSYNLVRYIIIVELINYGFKRKSEFKYYFEDIVVNLINGTIKKFNKNIVLMINNDFLCTYTLKNLLFFKSDKDENGVAHELAKSFIQAGIALRQDLFISLFGKIYRHGQTFIINKNKIQKKKVIIVSGTPGTGKTTISKKLAILLSGTYIDVNKIIKEYNLSEYYDNEKKCQVVDEKKLSKKLIEIIEDKKYKFKTIIIDSHMSHYLSKKYVDLCIITRCNLKELEQRLKNRGYNEQKVRDNLDCEIFEICLSEAFENKHNTIEISTDKEIDYDMLVKIVTDYNYLSK